MQLEKLNKKIVPDTYVCDVCNKEGDINTIIHITGIGLCHLKCYRETKKKTQNK